MRTHLFYLVGFCLFFFFNPVLGQIDSLKTKFLNAQEMQEDFALLCEAFQQTHPGLYRYTTPEQMQAKIDSIQGLIQQEMPFYSFYTILSSFVADIHCSHTQIYPHRKPIAYFRDQQKSFPLSIYPMEGKYVVVLNGTEDEGIKVGTEVLSINGQSMKAIEKQITRLHWGDGYIPGPRMKAMAQERFSMFYYARIEQPESFEVSLKNLKGEVYTRVLPAQPLSQTSQNFLKNPVNKKILEIYQAKNQKDKENNWRLKILDDPKAAVMIIREFNRGNSEEQARKAMRKFLKDCSKELKANQIENLIIDLRHNSGGWDIQGAELFSFLISEPTPYYQRLYTITQDSPYLKYLGLSPKQIERAGKELDAKGDGTFSLKAESNPTLEIIQPFPNGFKGKTYVLMNGASASTTAEFTALAKEHQLATFVGEECGGAYEGGNSGSFFEIPLPNSGIFVLSPLVYYALAVKAPAQKGRGTIPDYVRLPKLQDLMQGTDSQMQFLLDLIREGGE